MGCRLVSTVLLCLLSSTAALAAPRLKMHTVTPQNIASHELEFTIEILEEAGIWWFDVTVGEGEGTISPDCKGQLAVDAGTDVFLDSSVLVQVDPQNSEQGISYRFGVRTELITNSYFIFSNLFLTRRSTYQNSYKLELSDFLP